MKYIKIASLKTPSAFKDYQVKLGIEIPFETELQTGSKSPMTQPLVVDGLKIGNRWTALPMEGWDGTLDGRPTIHTFRRWERFGLSGAKLIWGGEAVAVCHDGRANPNQLCINPQTLPELAKLHQALITAHHRAHEDTSDLVTGLQLTHSGRYARPDASQPPKPQIAYDHPWLNKRLGLPMDGRHILSDEKIEELVVDFIKAAKMAYEIGFDFVDIKACHGYLGHEFLSAFDRPGKYGCTFENRTRFLREIIQGIHQTIPTLKIGVRLSAFDFVPFRPGKDSIGIPELDEGESYPYAFGGDGSGLGIDLQEPSALIEMLYGLGVRLVCVTGGSPYYNPHIQRPAFYPPSDGYQPPEDPLKGVYRQIAVTKQLKQNFPDMFLIGSAYSYLQDWLPNVAQAVVSQGMADSIGLGRMLLAYPEMPADILTGKPLQVKRICRTFSDCTTAPRNGLISGCYPLDSYYKTLPEQKILSQIKIGQKNQS